MFGVFSSSPASVLGNPAELRRVLAEIAAAQPDLAINELTGWVESVSEAANIDIAHHVNLLYQFDSSAQPHLRKLDSAYVDQPDGKDVVWRTGRDFWSILSSAYEFALDRYMSDPAQASVLSGLSRLASRTVRACRQRFKWDVYHNGPVDAGLWQVAGQAYLLAQASGAEVREVVREVEVEVVREVPVAGPGTMVIDKPLRSGQQVYARGRDLVVMAMVNPGAEVIADGHIHVYAPLRGKAIAGARGNADARIFALGMAPELISIAGIYRTSEVALPESIQGRTAQVRLVPGPDGDKLLIEAIGA